MRTATVREVVECILAHASGVPGGAIVFDGDGTLWSGDIGEDLFAGLLASGRIENDSLEPLVREARAAGIETHGSIVEIAHRIHAAYLADRFPEERVCEIMTWTFAGWTVDAMEAFAADLLERVTLRSRLHYEALEVIAAARTAGVRVCLVSASPRCVVHAAARLVGIAAADVASATEATLDGIVLADVDRPIPYGPGKVMRLRAMLGPAPLYAAFGDNAFDVPMLCEAISAIAIRPKARLVDRAGEVPGLVVLERLDAPRASQRG